MQSRRPNHVRTLVHAIIVACLCLTAVVILWIVFNHPGRKGQPKPEIEIGQTSSLATVSISPGWATFGLALPQGAARGAVDVGALTTQTNVKTTWPDGSIRYAVVTAKASAAGDYQINAGSPSIPQTWTASNLANTAVLFWLDEKQWTARPGPSKTDAWLTGNLVKEWRTTVAPKDTEGNPHPFLRVIFDTRRYRDGKARLDITVENCLNLAGAKEVTYHVGVYAAGSILTEKYNLTHQYLCRWRKTFDVGHRSAAVRHDVGAFVRANALPDYLPDMERVGYQPSGRQFDFLGIGDLHWDMPDHGGRQELAPYPDWCASYMAHRGADQLAYVLAHGDLAGSWPVHVREPDGSFVSIDKRPEFWIDDRGTDQPAGVMDFPLVYAYQPGTMQYARPDNAHQPSLAYVPYLLTGDRYYADEMAFWAYYCLLSSWPGFGPEPDGPGRIWSQQTRGIAWITRNMADAAAYLPDGDYRKAHLTQKLTNILRAFDQWAAEHKTPLGTYFEDERFPYLEYGLRTLTPWMNNFLAWAIDHANKQGFAEGQELRKKLTRFQWSLFTSPDFDRRYACPYVLVVGDARAGADVWFASLGQCLDATFGVVGDRGDPQPFAGYYGLDARLALQFAKRDGLAGADGALLWLEPQIAADVRRRCGWAIKE